MSEKYRIEKDTLGEVSVPADKLWGAQTQRSLDLFKIGDRTMPFDIIKGLAIGKKAAAYANHQLNALSTAKREMIAHCCDEIVNHELDEHFPLAIWQTGSGTQTNMNVNEVVANRAEIILKGEIETDDKFLSPNDDVNKSQSTNDIFPTAMRIAVAEIIHKETVPALEHFLETIAEKVDKFRAIKKIGRTHLMDATPLTLGEEFSGYHAQIEHGLASIKHSLPHLMELPIGGTAVGNGINTPKGYSELAVAFINQFTKLEFTPCQNRFEAMASHDSLVEISGALKRVAVSLTKIANDVRLLSSGPRCGIGEITIPANEPGSSIMPGKVNPTQCEALSMVCCQVIGNDMAITTGGMQGHLELNVFMPLIGFNLIQSSRLLADAVRSFDDHCFAGIEPDYEQIDKHLHNSLMLVTALNPHIGYYNAAKIAQHAFTHKLTLREATLELNMMTGEQFDEIMRELRIEN